MRMDIERVFLRVEARRARQAAQGNGVRCPQGCSAILANDTPALEKWDELLLEQWRTSNGLVDIPFEAEMHLSEAAACGVGG
jgi:hypothetical protein